MITEINARTTMYKLASPELIENLIELCKKARREKGYPEGKGKWKISGLLWHLGMSIQDKHGKKFP